MIQINFVLLFVMKSCCNVLYSAVVQMKQSLLQKYSPRMTIVVATHGHLDINGFNEYVHCIH